MGGRGVESEGGKNRRGRTGPSIEMIPVMEKSLMSREGENAGDGEDGINIRLARSIGEQKMEQPNLLLIKISVKIPPSSLFPTV